MGRGRLLAVLLVILIGAATWTALQRREPIPRVERSPDQNVLLITIDTLRADAMEMYGGRAQTPNLARLAEAGVRYAFAHAHAVYTLPSHSTILTGEYPFTHGARANGGFRLRPESVTLAERLKPLGFASGAFVAAFPVDRRFGLAQGFDEYDDRFGQGTGPVDFLVPQRDGAAVVGAAREWLRAQTSRWFVWVHLYEPHGPYTPPGQFASVYKHRPYDGEVAAADHFLGPLLEDVRNADRPTLVIVTGDHGEGLGDHGEVTHGLLAYETTLHVPLIVAQTGRTRRGHGVEVSNDPARHVDIVPTVLDALDQAMPGTLPGRSLLDRSRRASRDSYFEAMTGMLTRGAAPLSGVIVGREKLIDLPIPELYDLAADPREQTNLYARLPDRRRALEARLRSFGAAPPTGVMPEDPEVTARLRALGYVSSSVPRKAQYTEEDDPKRLVEIDADIFRSIWHFENRRFVESIALYRSIIERRPEIESVWRHMAFVQWESGDRAGAITTLQQAVQRGIATDETVQQLEEYLAAR
jgi:arylsulfatase A-like enzyme